jgi:hypothetical protein
MHGAKALVILLGAVWFLHGAEFSGASALEFTKQLVALGPRPPGSAAHKKMQDLPRQN